MIEKIKQLIIKYRELITYVIAGGLTTLVNWLTYTAMVKLTTLGDSLTGITISNAIAWIVGVIFAFVINKLWVFESKSKKAKVVIFEFISFTAARGVTGLIEIFGLPALIKIGLSQTIFGIEGMLAKVLVSVIVVILNYVFSKLIVFRKKNEE